MMIAVYGCPPKEFLACDSYPVLYSENGREALEILRACRFSPKLILLDLMMPVLDGWGFRLESRKDHTSLRNPHSDDGGTNGVARIATAGAKAIVCNPSRLSDLLHFISTGLSTCASRLL